MHTLNNEKETKLLFSDLLIRLCNPLLRCYVSCSARKVTYELEIDFLNWLMKLFLTYANSDKHSNNNLLELEIIESAQ